MTVYEFSCFIFAVLLLQWINAAAIVGLWLAHNNTFDNGRKAILHPFRRFTLKYLGDWCSKPVNGCPMCMASLWAGVPALVAGLVLMPSWGIVLAACAHACAVSFWAGMFTQAYSLLVKWNTEEGGSCKG